MIKAIYKGRVYLGLCFQRVRVQMADMVAGAEANGSYHLNIYVYIFIYMSVLCVLIHVHHMLLVPLEIRRWCRIPWDWSYGWL